MNSRENAMLLFVLFTLAGCASTPPRPPMPTDADYTAHEQCLRKFICGRIEHEKSKPSAEELESISVSATYVCAPPLQKKEMAFFVYGRGMDAVQEEAEREQMENEDTKRHAFAIALDQVNDCHAAPW